MHEAKLQERALQEQYSDSTCQITAQRLDWQRLQVWGAVLLPLPASQVWALITHPCNEMLFRHLESCTQHEVLHHDGSGRVVVESEHVATWHVLGLSGRLCTRLQVEQDHCRLQSAFRLLPSRFSLLRRFNGTWTVQPAPPERCARAQPGGHCTLLTLQQSLQTGVPLPLPLGGLLHKLACSQLKGIFQDLQQEARRINSGRPTLWQPSGTTG